MLLEPAEAMLDFGDFITAASGGLTLVMPDARHLRLAARATVGVAGGDTPIAVFKDAGYASD